MTWVWPTDISEYSVCPWKVYYKRVLNIHSEATSPMAVGWMEHEAWRRFYSYISQTDVNQLAVHALVSRCASEALDWALIGFDHYPDSLRSHLSELKSILSSEATRIFDVLDGKVPLESVLPFSTETWLASPELGIRGRVDLVYKSANGFEPWDIKTGRPPSELVDSYKLQVTAYALLLESNYDCNVVTGGLRFTGLRTEQAFSVTRELREEVMRITDLVRNMLISKEHPTAERLTGSNCQHCGYLQVCRELAEEERGAG